MQTTVEELDDNKVKLHVAVPADEFEQAINAAFRKAGPGGARPRLPSGQGAAEISRRASAPRSHGSRR